MNYTISPAALLYEVAVTETEMDRSIETRIAEAASDYKMALANEGFAAENGGVDKLRNDLFALVAEWEGEIDDADV